MTVPYKWTQANVVAALRNTVGDPSTGPGTRWTDAECSEYWNRAGQQLSLSIPELFETVWTIALVTDQEEYMLPAEFWADKRVEFAFSATDNRPLGYLTEEEWQEVGYNRDPSQTGEPYYYTFWRGLGGTTETDEQKPYIKVFPAPDTASNTKTLRIYGYKIPSMILASPSATLVVETEAPIVEAQIMYAAHLMMRDDDETGKARDFLQEYESQINKIKDWRATRTRSERPRMRPWTGSVFSRQAWRFRTPWNPWGRRY